MKIKIVVLFSIVLIGSLYSQVYAQKNEALLGKSVGRVYDTKFKEIKAYKGADLITVSAFFPDSLLKQYSKKIITSFQEYYEADWIKSKSIPAVSFDNFCNQEFNKQKSNLLKKIKKEEKESFIKADSIITPAFIEITQLAMNDYIAQLAKSQIESDIIIQKTQQDLSKGNDECKIRIKAIRDSINAENAKGVENKNKEILRIRKSINDSVALELKKFQSAVTAEKGLDALIRSVLNQKTDYSLKNITEDNISNINRSLYFISYFDDNAINLGLDNVKKNEVAVKRKNLNHIQQACNAFIEAKDFTSGKTNTISLESEDLLGIEYFDLWTFTTSQQNELKSEKVRVEQYKKIKQQFNLMMITLDGKDDEGRKNNFDKSVDRGRVYDEKKANMNRITTQFKQKYSNWEQFEGVKDKLKKVENQISSNPNGYFGQYTL